MSGVNASYFTNIQSKLSGIGSLVTQDEAAICADIQALENDVMTEIQSLITSLRQRIAELTPMTALPTDLPSCISWITNAAQPYIEAVAKAEAEIASLLSSVAELETAITHAASTLSSCTITPVTVS
jgi:peptidoglycan hydrolase CwlO-like protein